MKSKKIISFVLSLILMLSVFPQCILAAEENVSTSFEELLADPGLTALSVIDVFDKNEAVANADKPMTRKEFAKLAVKLMAMDNATDASGGKRYFYDVSVNDEYAPYIYTAASQGIIKPKQTNYFSPDAYITKVDAANALINILGYTLQLELMGATEQNIVAIAAKYGILDNITDGTFTSFDVYTMIKNALEVPVLEISSIGKSVSFSKNKDLGILAVYHDIYEENGVVTANSNTGLKRISDNTEPGYVKIGSELYALTEVDYSELLGHQIMFYYQKPQGKEIRKKLIYAEDDRTEILKLTPDDIDKFENMTYHYYDEKGKLEKASVKNADIIYNDTAVENYSYEYIPKNGDITLIDRDGDEKYEVIVINDYKDSLVLGAIFNENVVYFKSVPNIDLDDYPNLRIVNWSNMAALNAKGFRYQQSASIAYGVDGEPKKMIVYFSDLSGRIDAIETKGDKIIAEINGEEYEFTDAYYENIESGSIIQKAELGSNGRFYLNYSGKIYDWQSHDSPYNRDGKQFEVAIFDDIATEGTFESKIVGRFYTAIKDFEVIPFAEKVLIDGKAYKSYDKIYEQFCINGEEGTAESNPVKQFVRIKMNPIGEIIEIDKVGSKESGGIWKVDLPTTYDGKQHFTLSGRIVGEGSNASLTRNTAIITCPLDESGNLLLDDDDLLNFQDPRLIAEYTTRFPLEVYRVGEYDPEAVLVHRKETLVDTGTLVTGVFVVRSVRRKLDNNGDDRICIKVSERSEKIYTYWVDEDAVDIKALPVPGGKTHSLEEGDIVRLSTRGNDVVQIQVVLDGENDIVYTTTADGKPFSGGDNLLLYGYAKRRIEDRILFVSAAPGEEGAERAFSVLTDLSPVYVYDSEEKNFYRGHLEQITDYFSVGSDCSRLFIRFDTDTDFKPITVIIYK